MQNLMLTDKNVVFALEYCTVYNNINLKVIIIYKLY